MESANLGLKICHVLVTLRGQRHRVRDFILRMQFRAYLLYGAFIWNENTDFGALRNYNLSFVKTYCLNGENSRGYNFGAVWESEWAG